MKQFVKAIVNPNIEKSLKCGKPDLGKQLPSPKPTKWEEGNYEHRIRIKNYEKGTERYHGVRLKNRPKQ